MLQVTRMGYTGFEVIAHPAACACGIRFEVYVWKYRIRVYR